MFSYCLKKVLFLIAAVVHLIVICGICFVAAINYSFITK